MTENLKLLLLPLERIAKASIQDETLLPMFNDVISLLDRDVTLNIPLPNKLPLGKFLQRITYAAALYLIRKVPNSADICTDQLKLYLSKELIEIHSGIPASTKGRDFGESYYFIKDKYTLLSHDNLYFLVPIFKDIRYLILSQVDDYFELAHQATSPDNNICRLFKLIYRDIVILREVEFRLCKDLALIVDSYSI